MPSWRTKISGSVSAEVREATIAARLSVNGRRAHQMCKELVGGLYCCTLFSWGLCPHLMAGKAMLNEPLILSGCSLRALTARLGSQ